MRIGELAGLVGVTTRAIRHYHHLGLLPEPERRPNGYREYGLRHAVALARVLRLTELGLGLSEVRDVLADDAGRDLAEVLAELDADLARQEAAIRERRKRLRSLLDDAEHGRLSPEGPVSPELAAFFGEMARATAGHPRPESAMAAKDREFLALFDTTASPQDRAAFLTALRPALSTPGAVERAHAVYEQLDALADADLADPRTRSAVDEAARTLVDALPDSLLTHLGSQGAQAFAEGRAVRDDGFLEAFLADFAPAQAAAVQRAMGLLARRVADRPGAPREPDERGSR